MLQNCFYCQEGPLKVNPELKPPHHPQHTICIVFLVLSPADRMSNSSPSFCTYKYLKFVITFSFTFFLLQYMCTTSFHFLPSIYVLLFETGLDNLNKSLLESLASHPCFIGFQPIVQMQKDILSLCEVHLCFFQDGISSSRLCNPGSAAWRHWWCSLCFLTENWHFLMSRKQWWASQDHELIIRTPGLDTGLVTQKSGLTLTPVFGTNFRRMQVAIWCRGQQILH